MNLKFFIDKFRDLKLKSPRLFSSSRDNENCYYTDSIAYSKNCFYSFIGGWAEDCYYVYFVLKSKDCVDCTKIDQCELCYECIDCFQSYNLNFSQNCRMSRDSEYCYGLVDCHHCFLSSNLRHASYVFQNKKFSKSEYEEKLEVYKKFHTQEQLYNEFLFFLGSPIRINIQQINCEDCIGSELTNCKNVYHGFDLAMAEDFLYSEEGGYGKDCCDTFITTGELNYECYGVTKNSYNCNFCIDLTTCVDCEFCITGFNLHNCFGCCYLKDKKFYILNEPHSSEDYKKTVFDLKKQLLNVNLYGPALLEL